MAAQVAFTLADGQTTPVNHTFDPDGAYAEPSRALVRSTWTDRSASSLPLGQAVLREEHIRPTDGKAKERIRFVITVPTVATDAAGVTNLVRQAVFDGEFRFEPAATAAERANALAYAKNLFINAYMTSKVTNGVRTW